MINKCKRCGKCCEDVQLVISPKELEASYKAWHESDKSHSVRIFQEIYLLFPMLEFKFYDRHAGRWHYRCKHLTHENGLAKCTIYKYRPAMCSGFPFYDHSKEVRMGLEQSQDEPSQYEGCGYNRSSNLKEAT